MGSRKSEDYRSQDEIDDERVMRNAKIASVAVIVLVPSIMIGVGLWLKPPAAELEREYAAQLARSSQPDCPTLPSAKMRVHQTAPKP
jgi:hypothetical protein